MFEPTRQRNTGGTVYFQSKCKCGDWIGSARTDTKSKAIKAMKKHKKNCTSAGIKEGRICPACKMPSRRCKGKLAKCVNFDKDELRSSTTIHHGTKTVKGLKSASGARIPPGQSLTGIVRDENGKRVWDIKKRMGQE